MPTEFATPPPPPSPTTAGGGGGGDDPRLRLRIRAILKRSGGFEGWLHVAENGRCPLVGQVLDALRAQGKNPWLATVGEVVGEAVKITGVDAEKIQGRWNGADDPHDAD